MSSKSKQKGYRGEMAVVDALNQAGIPAERVPLSGSMGGKYSGDVVIGTIEHPILRIEVKHRENISAQIWDWLDGNDLLIIKRNHRKPLVVMDLDRFIEEYKNVSV